MAREPKRSTAQKHSTSEDVIKRFGGFTRGAKASRGWHVDERCPFKTSPTNKGK